jgi:uncharacterized protein YgbK (DUF1537 family)
MRRAGLPLRYKKVDSTLRGNVGAEILQVCAAGHLTVAVLAPTLPEAGRSVVGSELRVHGRLLSETEFGRDPFAAPRSSSIPAIIAQQSAQAIEPVGLAEVRDGTLAGRLHGSRSPQGAVIVCDAESAGDLDAIAKAVSESDALPCGSAGLLAALGPRLAASGSRDGARTPEDAGELSPPPSKAGILVVRGSPAEACRKQLDFFAARDARVIRIVLDLPRVFGHRRERVRERRRAAGAAITGIGSGGTVVLDAASWERERIAVEAGNDPGRLARRRKMLLQISSRIVRDTTAVCRPAALVILGGDTALAVCRRFGCRALTIDGPAGPLAARASLRGGRWDGLTVVTRAGGFGCEDDLAAIVERLGCPPGGAGG